MASASCSWPTCSGAWAAETWLGLVLMVWRGQTRSVVRRLGVAIRLLPVPGVRLDEAIPPGSLQVPFGLAACIGSVWWMVEREFGRSLWDAVAGLL
ncbi:MAG: hypothetical protein NTX40_09815 [Planctomycetota bacterium]|nr:hypothetical protein [Planctomycetota bacterium]